MQASEIYVQNLEKHLSEENPLLVDVARNFQTIDKVAHDLGFIKPDQSTARQIPWWPLISVLGLFSAGKSTFINDFLGRKIQLSGVQAVDDKFTVLSYSHDPEVKTLPGLALDVDPRFPFYQISHDIEDAMAGEGKRINAYLQLKTCNSENLKGKILIDSPGFDADTRRATTLRITKHIIDISDLVLIFFDARRPEPGAMRDTLEYLVKTTADRYDSEKFIYVLNQIDVTAREDSLAEVVAAWKSAMTEKGLNVTQFYTIFSPEVELKAGNEYVQKRLEARRERDLADIHRRMQEVEVKRAYRILNTLDTTTKELKDQAIPELLKALSGWRAWTLRLDMLLLAALIGGAVFAGIITGFWLSPLIDAVAAFAALGILAIFHMIFSGIFKSAYRRRLSKRQKSMKLRFNLVRGFNKCANWRTFATGKIKGWSESIGKQLDEIENHADVMIQRLNDQLTNPSGKETEREKVREMVTEVDPSKGYDAETVS
ncbi:dynamin family protein [Methylohalobius crimeensis]|uniref:dynamin family protein n=1 Tax=Methylohalobius crimeensis TaxID=244365 RepID=UPI0003B55775|nr:dynamin family protein [Methylohalobius crimeensis]